MVKGKIVPMTNREWMECNYPQGLEGIGCPYYYGLENHSRITRKPEGICDGWSFYSVDICGGCWNKPAKINDKYIMKVIEI